MNSINYGEARSKNLPDRQPVAVTSQEVISVLGYTSNGSHTLSFVRPLVSVPLFGFNKFKVWFSAKDDAMPAGAVITFKFYRTDFLPDGKYNKHQIGDTAGYPVIVPAVAAGTTVYMDFVDRMDILESATDVELTLSAPIDMGTGSGTIVLGMLYAPRAILSKKFEGVAAVEAGDAEAATYTYYMDLRAASSIGLQLILVPGSTGAFSATVEGTLNSADSPEDFAEAFWQDITEDLFPDTAAITASAIMVDAGDLSEKLAYLRIKVAVSTPDAATAFSILGVKA